MLQGALRGAQGELMESPTPPGLLPRVPSRTEHSRLALGAFLALGWARHGALLRKGGRTIDPQRLTEFATVGELALFLWTYGYEEEAELMLVSFRVLEDNRSPQPD